jgi:hypothetical protein
MVCLYTMVLSAPGSSVTLSFIYLMPFSDFYSFFFCYFLPIFLAFTYKIEQNYTKSI